MSTDLAGDVSNKTIEETVASLKQRFDFEIDGYENGKPVKRSIDAVPQWEEYHDWKTNKRANTIGLGTRFKGTFEQYLSCFEDAARKTVERTMNAHNYGWLHCFARILPHHHLVLTSSYYLKTIHNMKESLEGMGYTLVLEDPFDFEPYNLETKKGNVEFLKLLRDPAISALRAFDARAQIIADTLALQLSRETTGLRFGIYSPRRKNKGDLVSPGIYDEGPWEETEESKRRLHPVKKLVDLEFSEVNEGLEAMCKGLPLARAIGITSRVETSHEVMHIPMIDFDGENCYPEMALNSIGKRGMIIKSGNSYHFYGFDLMEEQEWKEFMLKLKEYGEKYSGVDKYWPDLQLRQGFSMLRITPMKTKRYQPCFVKFYSPEKVEGIGAKGVSMARPAKRERVAA